MKKAIPLFIFLLSALFCFSQDTIKNAHTIGQNNQNQRVGRGLMIPDTFIVNGNSIFNKYVKIDSLPNGTSADSIVVWNAVTGILHKVAQSTAILPIYTKNQVVFGDGVTPGGVTSTNMTWDSLYHQFFVGNPTGDYIHIDTGSIIMGNPTANEYLIIESHSPPLGRCNGSLRYYAGKSNPPILFGVGGGCASWLGDSTGLVSNTTWIWAGPKDHLIFDGSSHHQMELTVDGTEQFTLGFQGATHTWGIGVNNVLSPEYGAGVIYYGSSSTGWNGVGGSPRRFILDDKKSLYALTMLDGSGNRLLGVRANGTLYDTTLYYLNADTIFIPSTGSTDTLRTGYTGAIFQGGATVTTYTLTLPSNPYPSQRILINDDNVTFLAFSLDGNGKTISSSAQTKANVAMTAGSQLILQYKSGTWY